VAIAAIIGGAAYLEWVRRSGGISRRRVALIPDDLTVGARHQP
jgi:hypothetical protein